MVKATIPEAAALPQFASKALVTIGCTMRSICLWLTLLIVSVAAYAQGRHPAASNPADQGVIDEFNQRLQRYLDLRKQAQPSSPPQSSSAETLVLHRRHLRDQIVSVRFNARPGDVFTPEVAAYFKYQIAATLNGPHGPRIRASMKRAEPVHGIPVKVNGQYPANVPLQSTPPSLLLNLPQLPKELEYRVVNRDLVLRDKEANLIVDFIPGAVAAAPQTPPSGHVPPGRRSPHAPKAQPTP